MLNKRVNNVNSNVIIHIEGEGWMWSRCGLSGWYENGIFFHRINCSKVPMRIVLLEKIKKREK
jgi:hypothetical protein